MPKPQIDDRQKVMKKLSIRSDRKSISTQHKNSLPIPELKSDSVFLDMDLTFENIPKFPDIDNLDIPLVREIGIKNCIRKLGHFFNCEAYNENYLQFWFLDVITDCIWMCQDRFNFPNFITKNVLSWVLYAFDLIRDREKNLSKAEFMKIFRETLYVAADLIDEGCYEIPVPIRLVTILSSDQILSDDSEISRKESDISSKSESKDSSRNDYTSYVEIHGDNQVITHQMEHEPCICSQEPSTPSFSLKSDVSSNEEIQIRKDYEFNDLYKKDSNTPSRFKSEPEIIKPSSVRNMSISPNVSIVLPDQFGGGDAHSYINQYNKSQENSKFLLEIEGSSKKINFKDADKKSEILEKAYVIFRRPSWKSDSSIDIGSEKPSVTATKKKRRVNLSRKLRGSRRKKTKSRLFSRESSKSRLESKTSITSQSTIPSSKNQSTYLDKGESLDYLIKNRKIMDGLKLYKMWEQRKLDFTDSNVGLESWQMGKLQLEEKEGQKDDVEKDDEDDEVIDDLLDEELVEILKKQDINALNQKEFLSFGVLWAIIDFIYSYFSDPFQYLLIKTALTSEIPILTQKFDDKLWTPKDLKENLTVYVKDLHDKYKRFPIKKPKPKKEKSPKKSKQEKSENEKIKKEKPVKIFWIFFLLISSISSEDAPEKNKDKDFVEKVEETGKKEEAETKDDLLQSESKDPGKIEIIKQIKRVNPDGSYTFGYEAEDGSFKIESRDVLGNVKGTFGYVDQDGEIKRVSYSSTNNGTDPSLAQNQKEKIQIVQAVPKNLKPSPTTRRPTIIYPNITPSPSSTVIQTIPRRRIPKENVTTTSTTTEKPYRFEVTTSRSSQIQLADSSQRSQTPHQRTIYQNGHFIRSTLSPQVDVQRFTEGQLIRPTTGENVTPRPENYLRRLLVTKTPNLPEVSEVTPKPVVEEDQSSRGNLLRRQLSQEKVSDFTRQHIINLHQSTGHDANDVHSGSFTTGTPRPLFTTTSRPRNQPNQPSPPTTPKGIISINPAKYQNVFPRNNIRGPKFLEQQEQESSTDSSNLPEPNYVTPTPIPQIPIIQIPQDNRVEILGRSLPNGAILIPVNQIGVPQRYLYQMDDPNGQNGARYQQYQPDPYYDRSTQVPLVFRRPIYQDQQQPQMDLMEIRPFHVPVNTNLQDDIDSIKPPVSTLDFQKLLNRLIIRQNHLKEISRLESMRLDYGYRNPQPQLLPQAIPQNFFIRVPEPNGNNNNNRNPIQFVPRQIGQHFPQRYFIPMQSRMESQQYQNELPYDVPMYHHGRRVARLLENGSGSSRQMVPDNGENYLPPEVREMLLLKMLQLAINPNLPIPPTDQEIMTTANPSRKVQEQVRNVQILGEEQEEDRKRSSVSRSKRFDESEKESESEAVDADKEEMDYY